MKSIHSNELQERKRKLHQDWKIVDDHHLERLFSFENFLQALQFTNWIGALAETHDHHPDIHLSYGKVKIQLWTHTANGVTEKDFHLASLCDHAYHS